MSTEQLEHAIATTRGVMANVTAEQLGDPTPCASWSVGQLIDHIIGGHIFFAAGLNGVAPNSDETDFSAGDYLASFDAASAATVDAFNVDGALDKTVKMQFGEMPGAALMGLAMTDTFQHAWDLARATGQSTDLAPDLAATLLARSQQSISDAFRGPEGAPFGPQQDCPEGATAADELAAFLGRAI